MLRYSRSGNLSPRTLTVNYRLHAFQYSVETARFAPRYWNLFLFFFFLHTYCWSLKSLEEKLVVRGTNGGFERGWNFLYLLVLYRGIEATPRIKVFESEKILSRPSPVASLLYLVLLPIGGESAAIRASTVIPCARFSREWSPFEREEESRYSFDNR